MGGRRRRWCGVRPGCGWCGSAVLATGKCRHCFKQRIPSVLLGRPSRLFPGMAAKCCSPWGATTRTRTREDIRSGWRTVLESSLSVMATMAALRTGRRTSGTSCSSGDVPGDRRTLGFRTSPRRPPARCPYRGLRIGPSGPRGGLAGRARRRPRRSATGDRQPFAGWVRIVCSDAQGFAWSPSGVELVVAVGPPGGRVAGLVVVSVEDNRYRLLTRRRGILGDPVWVDPRTVAYVGVRDMSPCGQPTLWAVRTDGNGPRPVLPGLDRSVLTGDGVFPGAKPVRFGFGRVACAVRDGGEVAVWVADLAAGVARVLPQTRGQAVTGIAADDFGNLAWTGATENRPSRLFTGGVAYPRRWGTRMYGLRTSMSPRRRGGSSPVHRDGRSKDGWSGGGQATGS